MAAHSINKLLIKAYQDQGTTKLGWTASLVTTTTNLDNCEDNAYEEWVPW